MYANFQVAFSARAAGCCPLTGGWLTRTTKVVCMIKLISRDRLQAVKGTIQQAQNWTAETAGAIAQNAKSLAEELKKVRFIYCMV